MHTRDNNPDALFTQLAALDAALAETLHTRYETAKAKADEATRRYGKPRHGSHDMAAFHRAQMQETLDEARQALRGVMQRERGA